MAFTDWPFADSGKAIQRDLRVSKQPKLQKSIPEPFVGFCCQNIRAIFKEAFIGAGLPYFNPHSIRSTIVQLGHRTLRTPEEVKAWSQNLGYDNPLVTFSSHGTFSAPRQAEIILGLEAGKEDRHDKSAIAEMEALLACMKAQGKAIFLLHSKTR